VRLRGDSVTNVVSHWDEEYRSLSIRTSAQDSPVVIAALEHLENVAHRRLVDLGCGTGEASSFFTVHGAPVVRIDNLGAYCVEHSVRSVTPICMYTADVAQIGPCNVIFGSLVFHHVEPFEEFALALRATPPLKGVPLREQHEKQSTTPVVSTARGREAVGA
jgi:trans-aconitate methyltransferase